MDDFKSVFKKCFALILSNKEVEGVQESVIENCEKRLDGSLPISLKTFYLYAGNQVNINEANNRLISPNDIYIKDGFLVFYEENQRTAFWGIKWDERNEPNPPVYMGWYQSKKKLMWEIDKESISNFFVGMSYWQAVNGGMKYTALGFVNKTRLEDVKNMFPVIEKLDSFSVHGIDNFIAVIFPGREGNIPQIYIGSNELSTFEKIYNIPVLKWSYISSEDDNE